MNPPTEKCKGCEYLQYVDYDDTEAFDCGPRLRGYRDMKRIYFCEYFPDGVEPDKCEEMDF